MNVTMTMDEYQSLLRGVQLKSESEQKKEAESRKLKESEHERGRNAIAVLNQIERELARIDLAIQRGPNNGIIIVKKV